MDDTLRPRTKMALSVKSVKTSSLDMTKVDITIVMWERHDIQNRLLGQFIQYQHREGYSRTIP